MSYRTTLADLPMLTESELRSLNRLVVSQLKTVRAIDCEEKRSILREGDRVSWSGRRGYHEGTIVRVKRKKAIVNTGEFRDWDVPLNMLKKIA